MDQVVGLAFMDGLHVDVIGLILGAFLRPNAIDIAPIVDQVKHVGLILLRIELLCKV
jgi:hypothetical protein